VIAYQKDMMIKTYQEEVKDEADTENVDPQNNCVTGQTGTKDDTKMLAVHESTCQKGMTYKTYREEVEDEAYTEKVAMPGAVTNDDPQNNGVTGQTGAKDITKRLNVPNMLALPNVQEIPYQEDVKDKTYTYNIDVPGADANNDSNNYGPEHLRLRWELGLQPPTP
jgi:hypothetical protein